MENNLQNEIQIDTLLKTFRLTLTNLKIYPSNSPLVEKYINDFYSILKQLLQENTFITISELDGKIFINENEYKSKTSTSISNTTYISQFLTQVGIKSITFKKELTLTELNDFLIILTTRKPHLHTKELLLKAIEEKDIKNISIDEVEYISIIKSDHAVKSVLEKINKPISDLTELVNVLGDAFSEFDNIQGETTKKNLLNALAKYVSSLDMNLVKELFLQPLPPKIEQLGFKQQVFNNFTKQKVEEILHEIVNWCKQLRYKSENEAEYLEQLQHMKDFIKLVVNSPISKLLPVEIFEEIFKIGLIDALPEWVIKQKDENKSWIAEFDEILNSGDSTKLLQEKLLNNLQENIEKLCIIGLDDKIDKFISLMSENLSNPVIKVRQLASSALEDVSKQINKYQKTKIAKNLVSNIIKLLIKEQEPTIVNQYLSTLENSLICMVSSTDYSLFTEYAKQLLYFAEELQKSSPEKSKFIHLLLNKIYDKTKDIIFTTLTSLQTNQEQTESIFWFLKYIADKSIDTILQTITTTNNQKIIQNLVKILTSTNNQQLLIDAIQEFLTPQTPSHKTAKIIEILDKIDYDFSNILKNLYNYTTYANKVSILNYIQERPTDENLEWLGSLLETEESQIIEYLIDIITSLEYRFAGEKLLKLYKKLKDIDLKKRVCISLGILKEPKAINLLKKIILSKPGLFSKGEPLELRIVACWALSNYINLPEIKSFFKKLINNKEQTLANLAKEILKK